MWTPFGEYYLEKWICVQKKGSLLVKFPMVMPAPPKNHSDPCFWSFPQSNWNPWGNRAYRRLFITGFVLDFVCKFQEYSRTRNLCKTISMPYIVFLFSFLKKPILIFLPTSCKLSSCTDILIFGFINVSPIVNFELNFWNVS